MFPGQGTLQYSGGVSAMNNGGGNWFYNQSQYPVDPQCSSSSGVTPNEYQQYNCMWPQNFYNEQNIAYQEPNVPLPINNCQYVPLTPEPAIPPGFHLAATRHGVGAPFNMNVVRPNDGATKTIKKRKRTRTAFTTEQITALEEIFKTKQYITRKEREVIVQQLQLSDKPVKTWFQNRRLKSKRESEQIEEEEKEKGVPEQVEYVNGVRNDQENEKTDNLAPASLDDSFIRDLFDVTEQYMANNAAAANVNYEDVGVIDAPPIYEPISPASDSGSNDNEYYLNWEPAEPEESMRILSDLQLMCVL